MITMMVIQNKTQFITFIMAITAFVGFISIKGAVFGIATAGHYRVWGPPESNLADNNFVGLAMVLIIPLCFSQAKMQIKKIVSLGFMGIGFASIITCVLTYSRGALLGLFVVGFYYFYQTKNKIRSAIIIVIVIIAGLNYLPLTWFDRMHTIKTYEQDNSANQRLGSWLFSYNIAKGNILGGGFGCFTPETIFGLLPGSLYKYLL